MVELVPQGKDKDRRKNVVLQVRDMETHANLWSHPYPHEAPAVWPADNESMILAWDLGSTTARDEIAGSPALERQAAALAQKKQGLLLEIVNPKTGVHTH